MNIHPTNFKGNRQVVGTKYSSKKTILIEQKFSKQLIFKD